MSKACLFLLLVVVIVVGLTNASRRCGWKKNRGKCMKCSECVNKGNFLCNNFNSECKQKKGAGDVCCCYKKGESCTGSTTKNDVHSTIVQQQFKSHDNEVPVNDVCRGNTIDIAVVGAGASGTYSAWKLSEANPKKTIHIFEASSRVGGRLYSVSIPQISDFKANLGAMRFPSVHRVLRNLIQELGLTESSFTTPSSKDTLYFLRDTLLGPQDIATGNVPYSMTDEERSLSGDTDELQRYWLRQIIAKSSLRLSDVWKLKTKDRQFAYDKGVANAYLEVTSRDAIDYVAQRFLFPGLIENNMNYAEWLFLISLIPPAKPNTSPPPPSPTPTPPTQILTIKEGFQQLAETMKDRFLQQTRSQLFLNHTLQTVEFKDGLARLKFFHKSANEIVTVCARQVILALPAPALANIHFQNKDVSSVIQQNVKTVVRSPALKIYLAYDRPWWRTDPQGTQFEQLRSSGVDVKQIGTDLPVGTLLDIGVDKTTGKALLLCYPDSMDNFRFWEPYQESGVPHSSNIKSEGMVTENLLKQINLQLSRVFNISMSQLPQPYATVTHSWYRAPYWTAWHLSMAGYNFPEIVKQMMKPAVNRELYIVGEAFTEIHAWTEGALQTAQSVLSTYFGLKL